MTFSILTGLTGLEPSPPGLVGAGASGSAFLASAARRIGCSSLTDFTAAAGAGAVAGVSDRVTLLSRLSAANPLLPFRLWI